MPILDEHPIWIEMYWKCWKIAFQGIKEPGEESPLHGIKDLQVGELSVSLICDKRDSVNATPHLKVQNNKDFISIVHHNGQVYKYELESGSHNLEIN